MFLALLKKYAFHISLLHFYYKSVENFYTNETVPCESHIYSRDIFRSTLTTDVDLVIFMKLLHLNNFLIDKTYTILSVTKALLSSLLS